MKNEIEPMCQALGSIICIELDAGQPLGFRLAYNSNISRQISIEKTSAEENVLKREKDEKISGIFLESSKKGCGCSTEAINQDQCPIVENGGSNLSRVYSSNENSNVNLDQLRVSKVRKKSQAYKCGLRENDFIIKVIGFEGSLTYQNVMEYLRIRDNGPLMLVVKRGHENDPYPTLSCIDDNHPQQAGSPVPFGSPMSATTNVCCLHGVQSKAPSIRRPPPAITSGLLEENGEKEEIDGGWLSPLKKLFHFIKWENPKEQLPPTPSTTAESQQMPNFWAPVVTPSTNNLPNGSPGTKPESISGESYQQQNSQKEEEEKSWVTRALKRYVNMESMSKIPAFLAGKKSESDNNEFTDRESNRPSRILKVITQSTTSQPVRLEQRPSMNVKAIPIPPKVPVKPMISTIPQPQPMKFPLPKPEPLIFPEIEEKEIDEKIKRKPKKFIQPLHQIQNIEKPTKTKNILTTSPSPSPNRQSNPPKIIFPVPVPPLPKSTDQPSIIQIHLKPSLASSLLKKEDEQEEEDTSSIDSDEIRDQKIKSATIISVPRVIQHHGETTVHMHLKRHEMSMVLASSDGDESEQFSPTKPPSVPIIIIEEEEKSPEKEISPLTDDEQQFDELPYEESGQPPESIRSEITIQNFVPDEIWPIDFSIETNLGENFDVPRPFMEEAQIIPLSTYEEPSPVPPEPLFELPTIPEQQQNIEEITFPILAKPPPTFPKSVEEPTLELTFDFPTGLTELEEKKYFEFPLTTATDSLDDESDDKPLTVSTIRRQWPPPSNATGVEIVKDVLNRLENEVEEEPLPKEDSQAEAPKRHLFDERVAENVRACQSIVHELKASSDTNNDTQSKAQKMFTKRKQRSAKYVVSSPGPEVCSDSSEVRIARIDKPVTPPTENGDQNKMKRKIRNPMGDVHDFQQMRKEYGDIVTNIASAEKCQEISQALKSQTSSSKGAEMFVKRRQEAKDWIVDEHPPAALPPVAQMVTSVGATSSTVEPDQFEKKSDLPQSIGAGLPPIPVPYDSLRPFRRELERVASPTPINEWSLHDRHERIFSPIPFSTRVRAPSLERINFTPAAPRPFTPIVFDSSESVPHPPVRAQTVAYRSSSIVNDRFEADPSQPTVSSTPQSNRRVLPPRMNSFNTLPRSWKSYSDAYQRQRQQ